MTVALRITRAGPACTLQDQGRRGFLRFGVTTAGPMDWIAHAEARLLAGNLANGPAIEVGPGGLEAIAERGAIRIGLSAEGYKVTVGGASASSRGAVTLQDGERIVIAAGRTHLWAYLGWSGECGLSSVMGSLSTHVRSGVGPLGGQALTAGSIIPVIQSAAAIERAAVELVGDARPIGGVIRFVPGPQPDYFTSESYKTFCETEYRVSARCDRMGYRLEGARLQHSRGHDIVSDGIAMGAIQVPGDGFPIVLMADRQPTGGYPKIGTVIRADLPALAQARPGTAIRFTPVSIDAAVSALRAATPVPIDIDAMSRTRRGLNLELLLTGNYASGVVCAHCPQVVGPVETNG